MKGSNLMENLNVSGVSAPTYSYYVSAVDIPSLSADIDFTVSGVYIETIIPMTYITYVTICKINKKIYVGQKKILTKDFKTYLGSGIKIKLAIKKYGYENFYRETIEYNTSANIDDRETYWIAALSATDPKIGYNIAKGGKGSAGFKHTDKHKRKLRIIGKNRTHTLATKIKIGNRNRGKKLSVEARLKMSIAKKGHIPWNKGVVCSSETKRKISETKKKNGISEENIKKFIERIKGKRPKKFKYTLSNNENYYTIFNISQRKTIWMRFKSTKSNITTYKGIIIKRELLPKIEKENIRNA
jgi:group I intron endonuclease